MFEKILSQIGISLNKHNLPYMVVGAHALLLYGEPRLTRDVDITLGVDVDRLGEVLVVVQELNLKPLHFASPEDLIIHKVFAGRPRDIEDVRTVLLKNPDVDVQYIRGWLKEFDEASKEKDFLKTFEGIVKEV
jgi:hypothetical protein